MNVNAYLLWNPVNLILEGEWVTSIITLSLGGWLVARLFGAFIHRLEKRKDKSYGILAVEASYWPSVGFFCFLAFLFTVSYDRKKKTRRASNRRFPYRSFKSSYSRYPHCHAFFVA